MSGVVDLRVEHFHFFSELPLFAVSLCQPFLRLRSDCTQIFSGLVTMLLYVDQGVCHLLEICDLHFLRICFALHGFYICLQINYQTKLCAIIEDCKRISPIISFRRMICRCFFLHTDPFFIPGENFFQMIPSIVRTQSLFSDTLAAVRMKIPVPASL